MLSEIILAGIIVLLSLPIISSSVTMTPAMSMVTDAALVIAFLFAVMLIWHEQARDEREQLHRMMADRMGFLVGAAALVIITLYQSLHHQVSIFAPGVLLIMVIARIAGRLYGKTRQ